MSDIRGIPVDVPPQVAEAFLRGLNDLVRKTGCVITSSAPLFVEKHSTGRTLYEVELRGLYKRVNQKDG